MKRDNTDELLRRARSGDVSAVTGLMNRHRRRLKRMVACRMDPRVSARIDPSDVVQETLVEASQKLPEYLEDRPIAFYPWLRQICWQRLVKLHDFHLRAQKRTVRRERQMGMDLPDHSSVLLVNRIVGRRATPSKAAMKKELLAKVRAALDQLSEKDQEVLVMRYLEQLSAKEIAAVLGISDDAVNMRHVRALERIRVLLEDESFAG